MYQQGPFRLTRRELIKLAGISGAGAWLGSVGFGAIGGATRAVGEQVYIEAFPTSPLILNPFNDPLPVPKALAPSNPATWSSPPGPEKGRQDSEGGTHQIWPSQIQYLGSRLPEPIYYNIPLKVAGHRVTSSQVLAIDNAGKETISFDANGTVYPAGTRRDLPVSCIYGFNGAFPGALINNEYGRPALIRFENHLDENPENLDRQDFGAPSWGFLTHLHNGHTAAESDGNPHYKHNGYEPKQWVDNLYLNWPAGGDEREKQSFMWFHDHYHSHTGANVYKGMVGLFPIYDPYQSRDMGDETRGWRLPGVRTNRPDGAFDVEYDIPLALYDYRMDDGVTPHKDFHAGQGEVHPEWWGKSHFRHLPNHGFVGDVFTVNCVAYPRLDVKRRKYRLRFLDASISRIYDLQLMSSAQGPKAARDLGLAGDDLQGQYRLPDGQQCMSLLQIASEGGLIPTPFYRDHFELWPAKRREFIVDFTRYKDGTPTKKGDVIYLVNTMKMTDGRLWDSSDRDYKVPVLKIVIGDDAPDNSLIPTALRPVPLLPKGTQLEEMLKNRRVFRLERGSSKVSAETEWLINGLAFEEAMNVAEPKKDSWECWELQNGGGGWVHPMHLHEEEHRVVMRNGERAPDARHPDDVSREDVIALDPGESVVVARRFRTFTGPYVAHCHQLAHEDHAMMFGWSIVP